MFWYHRSSSPTGPLPKNDLAIGGVGCMHVQSHRRRTNLNYSYRLLCDDALLRSAEEMLDCRSLLQVDILAGKRIQRIAMGAQPVLCRVGVSDIFTSYISWDIIDIIKTNVFFPFL